MTIKKESITRTLRALVALALALGLVVPILRAQEIPDFVQVSGFSLPILRPGQYVLNFQPRYQYGPLTDSSWSVFAGAKGVLMNASSTEKRLQFGVSALYGISDRTSVALAVSYAPAQTTKNSWYATESADWLWRVWRGVQQLGREESSGFSSRVTLANRPVDRVEWNIGGYYEYFRQPLMHTYGEKELRWAPYQIGGGRTPIPSYPDIYGSPFDGVAQNRTERFGLHGGVTIAGGKELTTNDVCPRPFVLPTLVQGRSILALHMYLDRQPTDRSRLDQSIFDMGNTSVLYLSGYESEIVSTASYRAEALWMYGIADNWTSSLQIQVSPDQASAERSGISRYDAGPSLLSYLWYYRDWAASSRSAEIHIDGTLAAHPERNLELSLGARYAYRRGANDMRSVREFIEYDYGGRDPYRERTRSSGEEFEISLGASFLSDREKGGGYLQLAGYRLPVISPGEFALSGGASCSAAWSNATVEIGTWLWGLYPYPTAFASTQWRQHSLRFRSMVLYGLADDLSAQLSVECSPPLIHGSRSFAYVTNNVSLEDLYTGTLKPQDLSASIALAYRPLPGMEISFLAAYTDMRIPSTGRTIVQIIPTDYFEASVMRQRSYRFEAGVTLLNR